MSSNEKKVNRPADSAFKQQRLKAWQPILTPMWVMATFCVIGVVFIPIGAVLFSASNNIVEMRHQYDGDGTKSENSIPAKKGETTTGILTFKAEADMKGPVYIYYELENFYQNHRRYVKSRFDAQLRGFVPEYDDPKEAAKLFKGKSLADVKDSTGKTLASTFGTCDPMYVSPSFLETSKGLECKWNETNKDGDSCKVLWPCGLIAGSFFDDVFTPVGDWTRYHASTGWTETGIAWESDKVTKFKNPSGWDDNKWDRDQDSLYLWLHQRYERFDKLTNGTLKKEGVENEHFIVWMRTAGLPTFRKLYAIIGKDNDESTTTIKKGTEIKIKVHSHFIVEDFGGKKSLVISTVSWLGGKNDFLGIAYIVVGSISLVLAAAFFVKHMVSPRKLGDTTYIVWQDE